MRIIGVSLLVMAAAISTANAQQADGQQQAVGLSKAAGQPQAADQQAVGQQQTVGQQQAASQQAPAKKEWKRGLFVEARSRGDLSTGMAPGSLLEGGPTLTSWGAQAPRLGLAEAGKRLATSGTVVGLPTYRMSGAFKATQAGEYRFRTRIQFENRRKGSKFIDEIAFSCAGRAVISGNEYIGFDRAEVGDGKMADKSGRPTMVEFGTPVMPLEQSAYPIDELSVGCERLAPRNHSARFGERHIAIEDGYANVPTFELLVSGPGDGGKFRPIRDGEVFHDAALGSARDSAVAKVLSAEQRPDHASVKPGLIVSRGTSEASLGAVSRDMGLADKKAGFQPQYAVKTGEGIEASGYFVPAVAGNYTIAVEATQKSCDVRADREQEWSDKFYRADRELYKRYNSYNGPLAKEYDEKGPSACTPAYVHLSVGESSGEVEVAPAKAASDLVATSIKLSADGVYPLTVRATVGKDILDGLLEGDTTYSFRLLVKAPNDVGLRPVVQSELMYRIADLPEDKRGSGGGKAAPSKADYDAMK